MINFFRRIRKRLLSQSKFSKYLLYAIGEIVLVMIGILLALQVNNWNNHRKELNQEILLYENLLESLSADSADVDRVLILVKRGIRAQSFFLSNSLENIIDSHSLNEIKDSILLTEGVAYSFFPRRSAYDHVTNNGYLALLQSDQIKSKLTELYERNYKRYLHIDARVDEKSELHFQPILNGDFQIFNSQAKVHPADTFSLDKFRSHYASFLRECSSLFTTASYSERALLQSQESINELLTQIREELIRLER